MAEGSEKGPKVTMGDSAGPQNLTLNTHKAGMQGLDTEKINEIIRRASEGSRFYQHKQRHQEQLNEKLDAMRREAETLTHQQIIKATKQMDKLVQELEEERDLTRTIVHVDMDMFYAAVEMRDNPRLRDKPMAVGSTGMLSTSNYAARKFGVRAAMPGFIGKKLCPELVIVPPNFTKYRAASGEVREVFAQYDPGFSPMSLDEAYLDITDYIDKHSHLYSTPNDNDDNGMDSHEFVCQAVVREMRQKIQDKTQLTASAGIAVNTRLAKVCSDLDKPNGQYYLPPDRDRIITFVSSLPIRKISGIGNVMEQHLHVLDITQCGHITEKRGLLKLLFSETSYVNFLTIALGLGHSTLSSWTERDRKSISTETTFKGTSDRRTLFQLSGNLCQELAEDMEGKDILGKVLTLKLKTTDFQTRTRAQTLSEATRCPEVMAAGIKRLLQQEMNAAVDEPLSLRLLGVRMSSLVTEQGQRRQATLTQMFSQPVQHKTNTLSHTQTDRQQPNLNSEQHNAPTTSQAATVMKGKKAHKSSSIQTFLSKSARSPEEDTRMEVYECSVCEKMVNVESLEEFNKHLDACLEIHASPPIANCNSDVTPVMTNFDFGESELCKSVSSNEIKSDNIPHATQLVSNCNSNIIHGTTNLKQDFGDSVLCESVSTNEIHSESGNSDNIPRSTSSTVNQHQDKSLHTTHNQKGCKGVSNEEKLRYNIEISNKVKSPVRKSDNLPHSTTDQDHDKSLNTTHSQECNAVHGEGTQRCNVKISDRNVSTTISAANRSRGSFGTTGIKEGVRVREECEVVRGDRRQRDVKETIDRNHSTTTGKVNNKTDYYSAACSKNFMPEVVNGDEIKPDDVTKRSESNLDSSEAMQIKNFIPDAARDDKMKRDDVQESESDPTTSTGNETFLCPVCYRQSFTNIASLNTHMDECLNRNAISEILHETKQGTRHRADAPESHTRKRRKGSTADSNANKRSKVGFNTLDRYFRS